MSGKYEKTNFQTFHLTFSNCLSDILKICRPDRTDIWTPGPAAKKVALCSGKCHKASTINSRR